MKMSEYGLAQRSALMLLAFAVAGCASILISVVIARSVPVSEYGIYSLITYMQSIVLLLASMSMGTALAKFVAEYCVKSTSNAAALARMGLKIVLVSTTVSVIIYLVLARPIGHDLYSEPRITELVPFSALAVIGTSVFSTIYGIAQGCKRMDLLLMMQIGSPFLSLFGIVLLLPFIGIEGVFIGYFLSQSSLSIIVVYFLNARSLPVIRPSERSTKESGRVLMRFVVPGLISSLLVGPVIWIGNTHLAVTWGFQEIGYFAIAFVFFQMLSAIPKSLLVPLIPRISELSVTADDRIGLTTIQYIKTVSVIVFPLLFAPAVFSETVIELVYGSAYVASSRPALIMLAAGYFYTLWSVIGGVIIGKGRMWIAMGLNLTWASVFLILSFFLVPEWKAVGLAAAFAVSYWINMVNGLIVSKRLVKAEVVRAGSGALLASVLFLAAFVIDSFSPALAVRTAFLIGGLLLIFIIGKDTVRSLLARFRIRRRSYKH